jgi:hypothetical protein
MAAGGDGRNAGRNSAEAERRLTFRLKRLRLFDHLIFIQNAAHSNFRVERF